MDLYPEDDYLPPRAKVGFAIRSTNRDLVADTLLPDILSDHS